MQLCVVLDPEVSAQINKFDAVFAKVAEAALPLILLPSVPTAKISFEQSPRKEYAPAPPVHGPARTEFVAAVAAPVPPLLTPSVPVTPVVSGRPVKLVATPLAGVPSAGVVKVGAVKVSPAMVVVVLPLAIEVLPMIIGNPLPPAPVAAV